VPIGQEGLVGYSVAGLARGATVVLAVRGESAPAHARAGGRRLTTLKGDRVATWASHIRARLLFIVLDAVAVWVAYGVAEVTYWRDRPPALYWRHFIIFCAFALVLHLVINQMFGLYGRIWRHAGIEEARQVVFAAVCALLVLVVLRPLLAHVVEKVPLQVVLIGGAFNAMAMGALRFHSRLFAWQRGARAAGMRVAVIGSRDAGAAAVREMLRSPGAGLTPVAVFDEDTRGHGLSLMGVPVVGGIDDLPQAAARYGIQQVLLAIPNPPPAIVDRALRASESAGVAMKILPSVHDLMAGKDHVAKLRQAREPTIEDLLGRSAVNTDLGAVQAALAGHRVLITGAGGSIGSEIARQVAEFKPSQLILLDHDETHLHDTEIGISVSCDLVLADIVDRAAVFEIMERYRPEVVFHAAAHKHVPMLEAHPLEATKVNVFGTLNVVHAAAATRVKRFVLISSDKAVRPASVMGASKCLAEKVVLANRPQGASYSVVRFGNVLGSRGSVIPTFLRQIDHGGPVTLTDPRMTRFFMSVQEAVQLVLQASVLSDGGEIFMLEMGDPIRIMDLAERMVKLSGHDTGEDDIPISIVGVRPGEKLHEDLSDPLEDVFTTSHSSILRLAPADFDWEHMAGPLSHLREATARRDSSSETELERLVGSDQDADPDRDRDPVAS
jgi:FlaA1/EpsC-like NDP-sugar epimerase